MHTTLCLKARQHYRRSAGMCLPEAKDAAMRRLTVVLVLLALALATGCGSKSSGSTAGEAATAVQSAPAKHIHFAKTKFVIHAGLAFGAFHRYIYKPLREGAFRHPLQHKLALVKAAAAAAFVVHELRIAREDAQSSAVLRKLFSPLGALAASVGGLVAGLKAGHPDSAAVASSNGALESIKSTAASSGAAVTEHAPAL
jgi:hypothetical protein